MTAQTDAQHWVGTGVRRKQDNRLLTGRGKFTDDIDLPGQLYCMILRSPYAHAKIVSVDASAALALEGVVAVLTGAEAAQMSEPLPPAIDLATKHPKPYAIAVDKVRYAGEPVAAIAATSRYIAEDALALIDVEYEELPAVTSIEQAMAPGAPLLYEEWGTNLQLEYAFANGDIEQAFAEADLVVTDRIPHHRYSGAPMEGRAVLADYNGADNQLTVYCSTQAPHQIRTTIATVVRIPEQNVRVIAPQVGGGFGNKLQADAEVIPVMLSIKACCSVKWAEGRTENLISGVHSRDYYYDIEAAVKSDGTLLGIRHELWGNLGCDGADRAAGNGALLVACGYVPGPYKIQAYASKAFGVVTNKAPYGAYRGYGKDIANYVVERLMDRIARELGMSPVDIRMKNFIQPDEFPFQTITGPLYDSGNYQETMRTALRLIEYEKLRAKQEELRREGRYIGIGIASMTEPSGGSVPNCIFNAYEPATVRVGPNGGVTLLTGSIDIGQGTETTLAQVVADELGLTPDDVRVVSGDTDAVPYGLGSWSSRGATFAVSAAVRAARIVREKILNVAANMMEARADDLDVENGTIFVKDDPSREKTTTIADVAMAVHLFPGPLPVVPEGQQPTLEGTYVWTSPIARWVPDDQGRITLYGTHPSGTFISLVEVDPRTGVVKLLKLAIGHEAGTIINPAILEAQVHGGAVQGMAGALHEHLEYDENGTMVTLDFSDYLVPSAADTCDVVVEDIVCPSPFTELGSKGMGEGGAIPTPAAVANAVVDALAPFGVTNIEIPLHPEKVLEAIRQAQAQ